MIPLLILFSLRVLFRTAMSVYVCMCAQCSFFLPPRGNSSPPCSTPYYGVFVYLFSSCIASLVIALFYCSYEGVYVLVAGTHRMGGRVCCAYADKERYTVYTWSPYPKTFINALLRYPLEFLFIFFFAVLYLSAFRGLICADSSILVWRHRKLQEIGVCVFFF